MCRPRDRGRADLRGPSGQALTTGARNRVATWAPRRRRRQIRWRRRLAGLGVLLAPSVWLLGTDLCRRAGRIAGFDRTHQLGYVATAAASALFWTLVLYAAARRRGVLRQAAAGVFAVLFTLVAGVQAGFYHFYGVYLSLDGQVHARSLTQSLWGYLPLWEPVVALHLGLAVALALGLLVLARLYVRQCRLGRLLAPLLAAAALVGMSQIPSSYRTWQSSTPDVIYFHGFKALVEERLRQADNSPYLRVQRRLAQDVPRLSPRPARPRNVLFIVQESLRHDIACNVPGEEEGCASPFSGRATPHRFPLDQMRANASTTAISLTNLFAGVLPTESYELLLRVPLLFDYAHAAGYDTALWTSQHVMFGSMRLYVQDLPVSHRAFATTLDPYADFDAGAEDALLTDHVIRVWSELREPFLAVVEYSNGHFPYVYDAKYAPFQPSEFTKAPDKNEHFLNYFRNVQYLSDLATGRLIEHVRSSPTGRRTVIVYTSDHGESFREHWQLGHTSSLYDEEIHVPAWIDAPEGTLAPEEEASLRGAKDQFVWHLDLPPTVLDLLGVWDLPELRPFRARMIGHPVTRPERTVAPVPLTNCSWIWECAFRNWGMMQGRMKIEAREWDVEFHCFDLLADPQEQNNLGEDACAPLPSLARELFGPMPRYKPPDPKDLLWGPAPAASGGG
ncbi:MAG: sulfatase-like hydrolase/transferase [Deltaproteobacteria bacterium]|nr:sulfatase-like hydrolase/transferase [Deltaproteobacteria bacterium]